MGDPDVRSLLTAGSDMVGPRVKKPLPSRDQYMTDWDIVRLLSNVRRRRYFMNERYEASKMFFCKKTADVQHFR